jgi:hypothetical protein
MVHIYFFKNTFNGVGLLKKGGDLLPTLAVRREAGIFFR